MGQGRSCQSPPSRGEIGSFGLGASSVSAISASPQPYRSRPSPFCCSAATSISTNLVTLGGLNRAAG